MRKLIKRFNPGGVVMQPAPLLPTPPDLSSMIPNIDLSTIKLNLPQQYSNPYTGKTILGQNFLFNNNDKSSRFSQAFNKTNVGSTMSLAGGAADVLGSLIPKKEQSALTTGLNQGYDAAANAAMAIPGVGTIIGGAMKVGGMLSDGLTALGVGTDQMTTADKILDSKFLKWNVGLVNAIGAKKADTIYKDNEAFEQVGSSYGGVTDKVDNALTKSGKKYGLFSSRGRKKANAEIAEAKRQQGIMSDIADNARDAFTAQSSMSDINNRRYAFQLSGGYQNSLRVGQKGLKFPTKEQINRAKQVARKSKPTFESWVSTVPKDRMSENYDLKKAYEVLPFQMLENWRTSSVEDLEAGKNHLRSIYELPNGDYEFLKLGTEEVNPEVHFETDTYYDGTNGLKETHDLLFDKDSNRYYYKKRTQKFKEGGKMNVIPEGALHARLHHMDMEGITKKGIPVITKEEGGEIVQHAEIERDEIIFTKEVTEKLEELYKKGTDEAAIEAGKILAREIMENTQDNTGLMQTIS